MRGNSLLLVFCFMCAICAEEVRAGPSLPTTSDIICDIQKVEQEENVPSRQELADRMLSDLHNAWAAGAMNTIDYNVIDALISLLDNDDDWVRGQAASGIGYFGTRARGAIPALERALKRISDQNAKGKLGFGSGVDSASMIVPAMKRVQGIPDSQIFDVLPEQHAEP
jgi:hypothetical protein